MIRVAEVLPVEALRIERAVDLVEDQEKLVLHLAVDGRDLGGMTLAEFTALLNPHAGAL